MYQKVFKIPYGDKFENLKVPEKNILGVFNPVRLEEISDPRAVVRQEISQGLIKTGITDMISPKSKVAIGITDRTRVTPNKLFLKELINKLNTLGIPDNNISIFIGTGMHTPDNLEEIKKNVGAEVQSRIRIFNNRPFDKDLYVECGKTSFGTPVQVHKSFAEADIRIVTGNIIPCLMAGWTGGGKTVLPGVVSKETIYLNHKYSMTQLEKAGRGSMLGVLPPENIVRQDIEEAASIGGLNMAVNSVLNYDESIVQMMAGQHVEIHREGVNTALKALGAPFPKKADIIVAGVGSRGFEISLYQGGSRVLQALDGVINEGGTIIFTCESREGIYEGILKEVYTDWMRKMPTPEEIRSLTAADILPPEEGVVMYVFSWLIHKLKCNIVVVTGGMSDRELADMHMKRAVSLQEALDAALYDYGSNCEVAIMPYASMMLPYIK